MAQMTQLRNKLAAVRFEGKAGNNLVVARFRKTEDFHTVLEDFKIDAGLFSQAPDRVEALVKEAVNNALAKEVEELAKVMPKDIASNLGNIMK